MRDILAIGDVHKLHEIIMEKEREKQHMASDLDMAARLGLAISEANEDLQAKVQHESFDKLGKLQVLRPLFRYHI